MAEFMADDDIAGEPGPRGNGSEIDGRRIPGTGASYHSVPVESLRRVAADLAQLFFGVDVDNQEGALIWAVVFDGWEFFKAQVRDRPEIGRLHDKAKPVRVQRHRGRRIEGGMHWWNKCDAGLNASGDPGGGDRRPGAEADGASDSQWRVSQFARSSAAMALPNGARSSARANSR